jgi:RNA-binding protein YlmH
LVYKKLLELDPNTINSNQEEVVSTIRADVIIKELIEMSKDAAREALYKAFIRLLPSILAPI